MMRHPVQISLLLCGLCMIATLSSAAKLPAGSVNRVGPAGGVSIRLNDNSGVVVEQAGNKNPNDGWRIVISPGGADGSQPPQVLSGPTNQPNQHANKMPKQQQDRVMSTAAISTSRPPSDVQLAPAKPIPTHHQSGLITGSRERHDGYEHQKQQPPLDQVQPARDGQFPFVVRYEVVDERGVRQPFFCGGALVARRWVLSAAHCFCQGDVGELHSLRTVLVILGDYNKTMKEDSEQIIAVKRSVIHSDWHKRISSQKERIGDIMLLELERDAAITDFVQPLDLPRNPDIMPRGRAVAIGWATFNGSSTIDTQDVIQFSMMPIVPIVDCARSYSYSFRGNFTVHSATHICSGYINQHHIGMSSGPADSGGPLVCVYPPNVYQRSPGIPGAARKHNIQYLCGILNHSPGLYTEFPGVYANVAYYLPWIRSVMGYPEQEIHMSSVSGDSGSSEAARQSEHIHRQPPLPEPALPIKAESSNSGEYSAMSSGYAHQHLHHAQSEYDGPAKNNSRRMAASSTEQAANSTSTVTQQISRKPGDKVFARMAVQSASPPNIQSTKLAPTTPAVAASIDVSTSNSEPSKNASSSVKPEGWSPLVNLSPPLKDDN